MAGQRPRVPSPGPRRTALDARPPRYRLLTAASRLPRREPEPLSVSFERVCPACGELVLVTHTHGPEGPAYVDDHDCPGD